MITATTPFTRSYAAFALALAAAFVVSARPAAAQAPALTPDLAQVRSALDKYQDPLVAVRDGYLSTLSCIDFPQGGDDGVMKFKPGAMGVHLVNMGNIGPTLDPAKPQVLMYEPVGDKLRLIAAEWFVPAQLVQGEVPSVLGQKLQGPMDGHEPILPKELRHYDLHVWLWKPNPNGMFEPTNPSVKCPTGGFTHKEMAKHSH
jgi:hypothetical protein